MDDRFAKKKRAKSGNVATCIEHGARPREKPMNSLHVLGRSDEEDMNAGLGNMRNLRVCASEVTTDLEFCFRKCVAENHG